MEKIKEVESEKENENEKEKEKDKESEESEENEEEEEEEDDESQKSSESRSEKAPKNIYEKSHLLFSSGSLKNSGNNINNINNEEDNNKKGSSIMDRLPSFSLKRREKKNCTILFQTKASLNSQNINYPLDDLKPIPIIMSSQKELVYLYLTEFERDFLLKKLDTNNYYAIREEEIKNPLKIFIPLYYEKLFKSKGCLEKRLAKSLSEKMKDVKPNFSIAIEMDEKFKNIDIVKEQSAKYLIVKNDILKHLDMEKEGILTFDPFSKIKINDNKNKNKKDPIPKWAVSLKKQYCEGNLSDEENDVDEEDENKFNVKFYRRMTVSNSKIDLDKLKEAVKNYEKKNNENKIDENKNEDNDNKSDSDNKSDNKGDNDSNNSSNISFSHSSKISNKDNENESSSESSDDSDEDDEKYPYKKYIQKLFYSKLNDFRKEIIEDCFKNKQTFGKIDFQKFICLLEFFLSLFCGIQVKYSIDELGFLNMDLYASELIYMNMAEIFHYQVHFQIRDISHASGDENKNKPNLIHLNTKQYHEYNLEKIEYFPPSTAFIEELSNKFRRYTIKDSFHLCSECEKFFSRNKIEKAPCNSSVFRFLDKTRLLIMTLEGIIDINYLEKMIKSNNDEDNDDTQNQLFKATMILRNEELLDDIKDPLIFKSYLIPVNIKQNKRLNYIFRNLYGETIGYYYTWISHYLSWILFPAILGLLTEIILFYFNQNDINNYIYIGFLVLIILWGFYYVRDWDNFQMLYNHIWGMDSFKAEITNLFDDNYSKVSYVTFLGVKIPKVDKIHTLLVNFISIILVFLSSLFIMGVNVGIFKLHKMKFFFQKYIERLLGETKLSHEIGRYILPVIIYIAREIISTIFYKFSETLARLERPTDKEEYDEIVTKKRLTLEFVNYYFNLYYIAFYKKSKNTCENGDCFLELRKQIILILISNIFSVITQVIYRIIYLRRNIKNFEIKMTQRFTKNSGHIEKLKFYTREQFIEDDIQKLVMPIIFNFGYVIQFGICCPISFVFMLILVLFSRITNSISMVYLFYVKSINICKGLTVYNKTQFILVFVGIFSNIGIIFYTKNNSEKDFTIIYKLLMLIIIQNGILMIYSFFHFERLPFWFRYREIIKLRYLKKFGVAQSNKDKKKDNDNIQNKINKFQI